MKKLYALSLGLASLFAFAQQTISFESSEGYQVGDINGQNGWTVTQTSSGPLTNQVVSSEYAKTGTNSFKNAHVDQYQNQMVPIFGIEKSFVPSLDYKSTTLSYDFFAPQQPALGSDFEFAAYAVNPSEQVFDVLLAVGFENRGYIYLYTEKNFSGFLYANKTWVPNRWYNVKIKFTEDKISYYIDNELVHENANVDKVNIEGINFLHNNYKGDAYYDNITVTNDVLAVNGVQKESVKVYPNPVDDILIVQLPQGESVEHIEVYSFAGNKIVETKSENQIDLKHLQAGVYFVQAKTKGGKTYTSKIVKK